MAERQEERFAELQRLQYELSEKKKEFESVDRSDLSENEAYKHARQDLDAQTARVQLEERAIQLWENFKQQYERVKGSPIVQVGSGVVVERHKDNAVTQMYFLIVPPELADAENGALSSKSQLGAKLLNRRKGAEIEVVTSIRSLSYILKEVEVTK